MKTLKIDNLMYFFDDEKYEALVKQESPSSDDLQNSALAVIDPIKCEVILTRHRLDEVFYVALAQKY